MKTGALQMVQYRPAEGAASLARRLRNDPTEAEKAMWRLLRGNFPDARFRWQVPIRSFIVDFCSHRAKLVIEVDGGQHSEEQDADRTRLIEAEGYQVIRFWNNEVLGNAQGVAMSVAASLTALHPHPTLPHQGGGL